MADAITMSRMMFALAAMVLVFFGIYFTLSVICLHYLLSNRKRNNVVLAYTVLSLLISIVYMVATAKWTEIIFVENTKALKALSANLVLTEQVTYTIKIWLADSLLIYRLWVIWDSACFFVLFPAVLLLGCLGTGLAGIITLSQKQPLPLVINLGVAMHVCSIALNILATSMIAGKLLQKRRWAKTLELEHARVYLTMTAIFAESGALYSVFGIIYIPLIAVNSPLKYIFSPFMDAAAGIAPMLILLRVALGVAVSREALSGLSGGNRHIPEQVTTKASEVAFAPTHRGKTCPESFTDSNSILDCPSIVFINDDEQPKSEV